MFPSSQRSNSYKDGSEEELTRVEPSRSLQRLAPSLVFLFPALGLLPALLLESEPNEVFCKTPVGDDPSRGLPSQPSVMRLRADEFLQSPPLLLVLCRTSPRGPPMEVSQEMGIQLVCLWFGSLRTLPTPKPI